MRNEGNKLKHIFLKRGVLTIGNTIIEVKNGVARLEIEGGCANIISDAPVTIIGDVVGDVKSKRSISCRDVAGNVEGGTVNSHNVYCNVSARGSVQCMNVEGRIYAGGSVMIEKSGKDNQGNSCDKCAGGKAHE